MPCLECECWLCGVCAALNEFEQLHLNMPNTASHSQHPTSVYTTLPPVVQRVENNIHWMNLNPVDSAIHFANPCLLDGGLSVV